MLLCRFCPPGLFHDARVMALRRISAHFLSLSAAGFRQRHDGDDAACSTLRPAAYPHGLRILRAVKARPKTIIPSVMPLGSRVA
jgi:hypothetical protein